MSEIEFVARAADSFREIVRDIESSLLSARTPCADYDVRELMNHLLFWGPSLAGAAGKESVPPPAAAETEVDLNEGDWAAALDVYANLIVTAWSTPEAWTGSTQLVAPPELPASLIGGMVITELVVHGWDLARATGQDRVWDDDLVRYLHSEVMKSAEQGREMGIYGSEVVVPASSSTLDRMLGLTGRDPAWRP